MIIYSTEPGDGNPHWTVLLHFGIGLVGREIQRAIVASPRCRVELQVPLPWADVSTSSQAVDDVMSAALQVRAWIDSHEPSQRVLLPAGSERSMSPAFEAHHEAGEVTDHVADDGAERTSSIAGATSEDVKDPMGCPSLEASESASRLHNGEEVPIDLAVIWSAGAAGFSSSQADAALELDSFVAVLEMLRRLRRHGRFRRARILHVSSVGGLFEGHRCLSQESLCSYRRPYGWLKIFQERALGSLKDEFESRVYRLPSVFGVPEMNGRWSLIAVLIRNALHGVATSIVDRSTVLRDYVWNVDIGRYLAREAIKPRLSNSPEYAYLASGKPTSIMELIRRTERIVGRRLRYDVRGGSNNCKDITVSARALPTDWRTTSIEFSMRSVYRELLANQAKGKLVMQRR